MNDGVRPIDGEAWLRRVHRQRRAILDDVNQLQRFVDEGTPLWRIAQICATGRSRVRRAFDSAGLPQPSEV